MAAGACSAYEVGDGFPGQAWMSRVPLWKADIDRRPHARALDGGHRRRRALDRRAAAARRRRPVGVIVLVSRTPREPEAGLERLLEAIGGQVTQFLQRRAAESRAAEQAADLKTLSAVAHELAGADRPVRRPHTLCRAVRDVTRSASVDAAREPPTATRWRSRRRSAPPCAG